jgi:hypothetical protein
MSLVCWRTRIKFVVKFTLVFFFFFLWRRKDIEIGLYDILYERKPSCLIPSDGYACSGDSLRLKCFGKYCAIRKCARE